MDNQDPHQKSQDLTSSSSSRGFTLAEVLINSVVLLLIMAGIMVVMSQSQRSYSRQYQLMKASRVARMSMHQIQSFLRQAGNDPSGIGLVPVTRDNANQLTIRSDVTGSIGTGITATGEPDGTLDNLYEQVTISYVPVNDQLVITTSAGGTPQILANDIVELQWTFYDLSGTPNPAADADIARVAIRMAVETETDLETGTVNTLTLESEAMLRSQSFQFFE
jgi:type II secretory pathway pseudopilin PulG